MAATVNNPMDFGFTVTSSEEGSSSSSQSQSGSSATDSQANLSAGSALAQNSNQSILNQLTNVATSAQAQDNQAVNGIAGQITANTPNFNQAMAVIQGMSNQVSMDVLAQQMGQVNGSVGAAGGFGNSASTLISLLANQGISASASQAMATGMNDYIGAQGGALGEAAGAINGKQVNPLLEALLEAQKVSTEMTANQSEQSNTVTQNQSDSVGQTQSSGYETKTPTNSNAVALGISANPNHPALNSTYKG